MPLGFDWPLPATNQASWPWRMFSKMTVCSVSVLSKVWACWLNDITVHNSHVLVEAIEKRPPGRPVISVSNHQSCLDDPLLWGAIFDWRHCLRPSLMRWIPSAHDICFTHPITRRFFSLGRCVPIVRGDGVYQYGMDYSIEQLNRGEWVHVFPEGGVNMTKELMRLKWGIGRLICECTTCPIVVPMYHLGMDEILPNTPPYIPQVGKKVTVLIGKPLDLKETLERLRQEERSPTEMRKCITDRIQAEFRTMKAAAEKLHYK